VERVQRGRALNRLPLTADSTRDFDAMSMLGRPSLDAVIAVEDVKKAYGEVKAVEGVSFVVAKGEIFGLLGPNGAGKTTTMEMIEGLHAPDSGAIHVLGMDVRHAATAIKNRVGVQLQTAALYPQLTVTELLSLFGTFYARHQPVERLLEDLELGEKRNAQTKNLSGGSGSACRSRSPW